MRQIMTVHYMKKARTVTATSCKASLIDLMTGDHDTQSTTAAASYSAKHHSLEPKYTKDAATHVEGAFALCLQVEQAAGVLAP
jgi:hypothetical protein